MANVRVTLEDISRAGPSNDGKIDRTTEDDIRRHMIEDGEDPDSPLPVAVRVVESPASLRAKLGLTQTEMAARLRVSARTWRDWEEGRVELDPTARSLLDLVAEDPHHAFRVLSRQPSTP